jgi:hypothetical protein
MEATMVFMAFCHVRLELDVLSMMDRQPALLNAKQFDL